MIDIKQTDTGDVDLTTGDIVLVESTGQHQRDILIASQGHYKETPGTGVGSFNYLLGADESAYLRVIRKQFSKDGMRVASVGYVHGNVKVAAEYEDNNG